MAHAIRISGGLRALYTALPPSSVSRGAARLYSQLTRRQLRPSLATHSLNHINSGVAKPSISIRYNSNNANPSSSAPLTDRQTDATTDAEHAEQNRQRRAQEEAYQLVFTCKPCGTRSAHRVSKHGYHRGTVLISCPGCGNRHVISDNLNIFFDQSKTLDDLLKEHGEKVTVGEMHGDMEFWSDGTVTKGRADPGEGGKSE